jgi:hypothetical protein
MKGAVFRKNPLACPGMEPGRPADKPLPESSYSRQEKYMMQMHHNFVIAMREKSA